MLWLRRPPWVKWIATGLIVAIAFWVEMRPETTVPHPFATFEIPAGEPITAANAELRDVPTGLFQPVRLGEVTTAKVAEGDPVLASATGEGGDPLVPAGWWIITTDLPRIAGIGDSVQIVLLDTGETVPGVVVDAGSDDPFASDSGAVAVGPKAAAMVAQLAAIGRITVLISTG